jgi:hypothetical protein
MVPVRTRSAEYVPARELPHARDELQEAAGEDGHADDDVRVRDAAHAHVEHRQDEGRRREREDAAIMMNLDIKKEIKKRSVGWL